MLFGIARLCAAWDANSPTASFLGACTFMLAMIARIINSIESIQPTLLAAMVEFPGMLAAGGGFLTVLQQRSSAAKQETAAALM